MPFKFPGFSDVLYRLLRLRRLLLAATLLPVATFALNQALATLWTGQPFAGLFAFTIFAFALVALHAVLFPNMMAETMTVSLALAVLVIAAPLAGGSILGWLVLILIAAWIAVFGQNRLLNWQISSDKSQVVLTARVKVCGDKAQILASFAPTPGQDAVDKQTGQADENGYFPTFITSHSQEMTEGFDADIDAHLKQQYDAARAEVEDDLDLIDYDDLHDNNQVVPSYWARIETQTEDYQKTAILSGASVDALIPHSTVEHRLKPSGKGWVVTEIETVKSFERGLSLGMWMTDYQKDGLVMLRDRIEARAVRAIRLQHQHGMLSLIGRAFLKRQLRRQMTEPDTDDLG